MREEAPIAPHHPVTHESPPPIRLVNETRTLGQRSNARPAVAPTATRATGLGGLCAIPSLLMLFAGAASASSDSIEPPPSVGSFEEIDRALDGTWLVAPNATWRYFPGEMNPARLAYPELMNPPQQTPSEGDQTADQTVEGAGDAQPSEEKAEEEADEEVTETSSEAAAEGGAGEGAGKEADEDAGQADEEPAPEPAPRRRLDPFIWAKEGYDDSSWREGSAPFIFGEQPGDTSDATVIAEMGSGITSVYMRRSLELTDLNRYERIVAEIPVDDGFMFFLNGSPTKRRGAGSSLIIPGPAFTASSQRDTTTRPIPVADLTRTITSGFNQLAVHAFLHAEDAATFAVHPRVWATFRRDDSIERERYELVKALIEGSGDDAASRLQYLESRRAQRSGDWDSAQRGYAELCKLEPENALLWSRLVECHSEMGSLAELDATCREQLALDPSTAMLETWAQFSLEALGRTPQDLAALLPAGLVLTEHSLLADTRWLAATLAREGTLRIDCGQGRDHEVGGETWSRDRFFAAGSQARTTASDGTTPRAWGADRTVRIASRSYDDLLPLYRIPLPAGPYEVRLGFVGNNGDLAEVDEAKVDVFLDGALVLGDYDPVVEAGRRGIDRHSFPIWVDDGFLDIDLVKRGTLIPWIASVEVEAVSVEHFSEHTAAWVDSSGGTTALALAEHGRALAESGDLAGARAMLVAAEQLPSRRASDVERLSRLRLNALPRVSSFAAADDLAQRHNAACEARLDEILSAAEGQEFATYLVGRVHQVAGRTEEALGAFEELVASGSRAPEPYVSMAQCLVDAELPEYALDILREGRESGVQPNEDWLELWISLNLKTLGRKPWEVIKDLEGMTAPAELVVVETSERSPQTWRTNAAEPPSTSWCRTSFDPTGWAPVMGPIGVGQPTGTRPRGLWNTDSTYARRKFQLDAPGLLYPHLSVLSGSAVNVYINGTAPGYVGVDTTGYIQIPARQTDWLKGDNVIGMHAFNQRGSALADVGVVQPIEALTWISRQLDEHGALRFNCGGPEYTATDGKVFAADRFFGWGPALVRAPEDPWIEVAETSDDELYHTVRAYYANSSSTWYQVPVPNGRYRARLHFAEIDDDSSEAEKRTFSVSLEKKPVLRGHDIVASVGFQTAQILEFEVAISDGYFDLRLADLEHNPIISALEIERLSD